jgi:hypothetical protein
MLSWLRRSSSDTRTKSIDAYPLSDATVSQPLPPDVAELHRKAMRLIVKASQRRRDTLPPLPLSGPTAERATQLMRDHANAAAAIIADCEGQHQNFLGFAMFLSVMLPKAAEAHQVPKDLANLRSDRAQEQDNPKPLDYIRAPFLDPIDDIASLCGKKIVTRDTVSAMALPHHSQPRHQSEKLWRQFLTEADSALAAEEQRILIPDYKNKNLGLVANRAVRTIVDEERDYGFANARLSLFLLHVRLTRAREAFREHVDAAYVNGATSYGHLLNVVAKHL